MNNIKRTQGPVLGGKVQGIDNKVQGKKKDKKTTDHRAQEKRLNWNF